MIWRRCMCVLAGWLVLLAWLGPLLVATDSPSSPSLARPSRARLTSPTPAGPPRASGAATVPRAAEHLGSTRLAFIEDRRGDTTRSRYRATTGAQTLWFTDEGIVFDLSRGGLSGEGRREDGNRRPAARERLVFRQRLVGATRSAHLVADGPLPGTYNFFLGGDRARWQTGLHGHADITYRDVYPGVDLRLYGNGRALEQEFVVPAGSGSRPYCHHVRRH